MNDKEKVQIIKELCKKWDTNKKSYILDQINRIVTQPDEIIIPFKFELTRGHGQMIGLPFGDNQILVAGNETPWYVACRNKYNNRKMKLGKEVARYELKTGHWYYVFDGTDINHEVLFQDKDQYKLYIGDGKFVFIENDKNVFVSDTIWNHYYTIEVAND